jgi:large subunit ribosomal protein L3
MPGSIGPKGPAHVFKGTKMGGRMGGERVTTTNLEIWSIDEENNTLFVKGAVPGAINGLVLVNSKGELKVNQKPVKTEEVKAEEPKKVEEVKTEEPKKVEEVKTEEPKKVEEVKTEEKVS